MATGLWYRFGSDEFLEMTLSVCVEGRGRWMGACGKALLTTCGNTCNQKSKGVGGGSGVVLNQSTFSQNAFLLLYCNIYNTSMSEDNRFLHWAVKTKEW